MDRYKYYKPAPNVDASDERRGLMTPAQVGKLGNLGTKLAFERSTDLAVPVNTYTAIGSLDLTAGAWLVQGFMSCATPGLISFQSYISGPGGGYLSTFHSISFPSGYNGGIFSPLGVANLPTGGTVVFYVAGTLAFTARASGGPFGAGGATGSKSGLMAVRIG